MSDTKVIGNIGEDAVVRYLEDRGFEILVRNFTVHNAGELDVVAVRGNEVYVVEVKTRAGQNLRAYGAPEAFITKSKVMKIRKTIRFLVAKYKLYDKNIVLAAGAVVHDGKGEIISVEVVEI